ncbi:IS110 family transposase [Actinoplanes sp. NPDC051346]|uniref:IS110 family transposase n=1 Tax=Actinoplanes sp. NPDC051346 TaxID=3155048 RepID=UPI00343A63A3
MATMTHPPVQVTAGVDTHKDTHTAAAVDDAGRLLGTAQFPATPAGHRQLLDWLRRHGTVTLIGVEGTGAYGAGLTRYLSTQQISVVEVDRPDRATRRHRGKSDPVDAESAARAALSKRATGTPKQRDGRVEALRQLRLARSCAVKHRAELQQRLHALIVTAGEPLRGKLRALTAAQLVHVCARLRPDPTHAGNPDTATKIALRSIARRHTQLSAEIHALDQVINPLVKAINPALSATHGVGPEVAGQLLVTAGDNPHRLRTEAAFAMLCGAAPLPASSGKTHRHRLNRGGDRQANCALYRIVLTRLARDPRTRAYRDRRLQQGLSRPEIFRCLKRYIAREIYTLLTT